ncbi:MAG: hypothetical protein A3J83_07620 [Elusimicrobia bacterium RIFOXYA2_FULL_40_6]|nr:MAG: hypothetical protein A3J83_07620 [Elusimicrobia bacterium RIFOXYA2_FULL_40_6]
MNIFLLDDQNYARHIENAAVSLSEYKVMKFSSMRELFNNVVVSRPQIIFISARKADSGTARKILANFSFIPAIAYGDFAKNPAKSNRKIQSLLTEGYAACINASVLIDKDSLLFQVKNLLWQGLAKNDLWEKEYSIVRTESKNRIYKKFLAACVTLLVLVVAGFVSRDKVVLTENMAPIVYSVPYLNLSGITLSKNSLWTSDWQTQNVYKHSLSSNLEIEHVYPFPEMRFSALVVAEGYMWTLDPWQKKIRKHNLDKKLSIIREFTAPGPNPTGIAYDGRYLLTCDNSQGKLYVHKLDDKLTVLKEYVLPASDPVGIYADGKSVWIADSVANKIYCCSIDDFDLTVKNIFIPPDYEGLKFTSLTGDRDFLWLASEKESKIYKYPKKMLEAVE